MNIKNQKFFKNITGETYGKLTALKPAGRTNQGAVTWLCLCDWGATIITSGTNLRAGMVKSCGCSKIDAGRKPIKSGMAIMDAGRRAQERGRELARELELIA